VADTGNPGVVPAPSPLTPGRPRRAASSTEGSASARPWQARSSQPDPVTLFDSILGTDAIPSWQVEVTGLAVDDRAVYLLGPVGGGPELWIFDKPCATTIPRRRAVDGRPTEISVLPGPDGSLAALLGDGQLRIHEPMSDRVTTYPLSADARGLAADIDRRLFYVGLTNEIAVVDPDAGRRLCGIAVPGRPVQLVCTEDGTLAVLLEGEDDQAVAMLEPNTTQVELIDLPKGCRPRTLGYDIGSGLIFLAVDANAAEPAGIVVIDRDSGRRVGGVIETSGPPTTLTLLRPGSRTHLYAGVPGVGLEVVDVARRAVVGRLAAPWLGPRAAADQNAGELYVADRFSGVRRIVPLIGGGPIAQHLTQITATEQIAPPLSGPRTTPDGSTEMQNFDIGTVVASTDAGTVILDPTHAELWLNATGPAVGTASAADQLGNPVGDTIAEADHLVTYFERGLMVTMPLATSTTVAVPEPLFEANFQIDGLDVAGELEFLLGRER